MNTAAILVLVLLAVLANANLVYPARVNCWCTYDSKAKTEKIANHFARLAGKFAID
jgi:hypothetical protein